MEDPSCEPAVRIAGLCGSLRIGSYTRMALEIALRGAAGMGCQTDLIVLRDFHLPFAGEEDGSPDTALFCERLRSADGVILGTPEYHGSFSGVLKNALDLTGF